MSPIPPDECDTPESQRDYFEDIARAIDEYEAEAETNR